MAIWEGWNQEAPGERGGHHPSRPLSSIFLPTLTDVSSMGLFLGLATLWLL
jgi:hypothetical protein